MKTVTDDFVTAQKRPDTVVVREVQYKRRYWDASTDAYVYESSWTTLDEEEVVRITPTSWNLDNSQLNEFKVANISIILRNFDNKWRIDNRAGIFGQDADSPMWPYEPYLMKFRVNVGFQLDDVTEETVPIFSGFLTEIVHNSKGEAQVRLEGIETSLRQTSAEDMATSVSRENVGTGDGSTTDFTTTNNGVGRIERVEVAGVLQFEDDDYTVSNLNDPSNPATISFTSAPSSGDIEVNYFYLPQNKSSKELVGLLLDEAGISSGDRVIQDVTFPNDVINTNVITSQADFEAGSNTRLNTTKSPGRAHIDWTSSVFEIAKPWSQSIAGWTVTKDDGSSTVTSDGTWLVFDGDSSGGIAGAYRSFSNKWGRFQFDYQFVNDASGSAVSDNAIRVEFGPQAGVFRTRGLHVVITHDNIEIAIGGRDTPPDSDFFTTMPVPTTLKTFDQTSVNGSTYEMRFIHYGETLTVFRDSIELGKIDLEQNDVQFVNVDFLGEPSQESKVKDFVVPVDTATATFHSATIDAGSTPTAWGQYESTDFQGNAESDPFTYYVRTSSDGMSWGGWEEVTDLQPSNTLQRYIQTKVEFSFPTSTLSTRGSDIYVDEIIVRFTTTSTRITMADFSGLSVYDAIRRVASFANYEFGFNPDETFFFRPKGAKSPVMNLTQSNFISEIRSIDSGLSRVFGLVRITYGDRVAVITDDGLHPFSPVARAQNKQFSLSPDTGIIIPASADIATGVAKTYFNYLSRPRRRFTMITKLIPQLDLSDIVKVSFEDNRPTIYWHLGDPDVNHGQVGLEHWGSGNQIIDNMTAKIIGARYDVEKYECEFECEEVL